MSSSITLGLIGGSGLLKTKLQALQNLTEERVETIHGAVFLRSGLLPGGSGAKLVFVQRHDARPSRTYTQPADINYAALALALSIKKCDVVVGICSVGSLKESIGVGSMLVCDDFWCPFDLRRVYSDFRAHFMPSFDAPLRTALIETLRLGGLHPLPNGVYGNAKGPRFETKSEIRMMATYCDVVGMTAAHEVAACCEVGLPYAMVCMVDNYANGIGQEALTLDAFHHAQAANLVVVEKAVDLLLQRLPSIIADEKKKKNSSTSMAEDESSSSNNSTGAGAMVTSTSSTTKSAVTTPTKVDLIIHGRFVVPVAAGREGEELPNHSVVVQGELIYDILPTEEVSKLYSAAKVVDLSASHVLMPGLVNAHTHLALNFLRGIADDLPLAQWLSEHIWPTEGRLVNAEFVKAGSKAACAELIKGGVTTLNDMYWFPGAAAEAIESVGIRALLAMVVLEFPSGYAGNSDEYFTNGLKIREEWSKKKATSSRRIQFGLGPHAPYTVSDTSFARVRDVSAEHNLRVHCHLHETAGEVKASQTGGKEGTPSSKHISDQLCSPIDNLSRLGLVNDRLIAVHMTALSDKEIQTVASGGAHVVHCPSSNLKLASGFCPVARLISAGVNVAIGTDSASSNNSLNMFSEMKTAALLAKGVAGDATVVPAATALRMATLNGARALGMADITGSLEVGKQCDLIAVKVLGEVEFEPLFSVVSHLVYVADRNHVTDVWVAGQQLLDNKRLTTIDEEEVVRVSKEMGAKVKEHRAETSTLKINSSHRRCC